MANVLSRGQAGVRSTEAKSNRAKLYRPPRRVFPRTGVGLGVGTYCSTPRKRLTDVESLAFVCGWFPLARATSPDDDGYGGGSGGGDGGGALLIQPNKHHFKAQNPA